MDSDYDYADTAFADLGREVMAGRLQLAKVYGQEEPPAAEDELEWETRHFTLFDSARICHFDDFVGGEPQGDRGLIDLATISSVDKVAGMPTFVLKSSNKVYLFKLEGAPDEERMRAWTDAIALALSAGA